MSPTCKELIVEKGVSVIVPVYNEEEGLRHFLPQIQSFSENCSYPLEIIMVDDGSTDQSSSVLNEFPYTTIRHESNLGYGAAIKTGIENSTYEAVVIIDADGTYRTEDILLILSSLDQNDMVVGARTGGNARVPFSRRPVKWLIRQFATWMVRRPIPDLNSGLRAFRRSEIAKFVRLLPDGFSLTTTLTVAFHTAGRKVYYQPIQYGERSGLSKFRPLADTWNLILLILRTVVLIRPLNVFLPLSLILAAMALLVLVVTKLILHEFYDATFIVLMMGSIQMFVLGLIADLIVRINLWTH